MKLPSAFCSSFSLQDWTENWTLASLNQHLIVKLSSSSSENKEFLLSDTLQKKMLLIEW